MQDIVKLQKYARENNLKIVIYLKKSRYRIQISNFIQALDPEGRVTEWGKAFGPQTPSDVLQSYGISRVEIRYSNGSTRNLNPSDLKSLVKALP